MATDLDPDENNWHQKTIEKLALSSLKEQQATRRWGIFFKFLIFAYLFTVLAYSLGWVGMNVKSPTGKHSAIINITGVIEPGGEVNADAVMGSLADAYDSKGTKRSLLRPRMTF